MSDSINELARKLKPIFLGWIPDAIASGGAGGTVIGAPSPHDLAGPHHTGQVVDAQAPQFLKADGSRPLTGNLPVAAGVTIDGVDLSAHAADVNAHHNQVHSITGGDHSVTGSQYQLVGLTAANTLGLITPASTVGANTIPIGDGSGGLTWNGIQTWLNAANRLGNSGTTVNLDGSNKRIGTSDFASNNKGWRIDANGDAEFNNIVARGEFHASIFVMDEFHATGGTLFVSSASKLINDATSVNSPSTFTIDIEDPPSGHAQIFSVNDILRIKVFNGSSLIDNWLKVTAVSNQTTFYRYTVQKQSGTAGLLPKGTAIVSYGQGSAGRVLITSDLPNGPYIDIFESGSTPWTGTTLKTRLGRLDGITDADLNPSGYGLYTVNGYFKGLIKAGNGLVTIDNNGILIGKQNQNDIGVLNWQSSGTTLGDLLGLRLGAAAPFNNVLQARGISAATDTSSMISRAEISGGNFIESRKDANGPGNTLQWRIQGSHGGSAKVWLELDVNTAGIGELFLVADAGVHTSGAFYPGTGSATQTSRRFYTASDLSDLIADGSFRVLGTLKTTNKIYPGTGSATQTSRGISDGGSGWGTTFDASISIWDRIYVAGQSALDSTRFIDATADGIVVEPALLVNTTTKATLGRATVNAGANGEGVAVVGNSSSAISAGFLLYDGSTLRGALGVAGTGSGWTDGATVGDVTLRTEGKRLFLTVKQGSYYLPWHMYRDYQDVQGTSCTFQYRGMGVFLCMITERPQDTNYVKSWVGIISHGRQYNGGQYTGVTSVTTLHTFKSESLSDLSVTVAPVAGSFGSDFIITVSGLNPGTGTSRVSLTFWRLTSDL